MIQIAVIQLTENYINELCHDRKHRKHHGRSVLGLNRCYFIQILGLRSERLTHNLECNKNENLNEQAAKSEKIEPIEQRATDSRTGKMAGCGKISAKRLI